MLNFRKLKHDFAPTILNEGKMLFGQNMVISTKITHLQQGSVRFSCQVMGSFDHCYESELEIDRHESIILDSDCDCTYKYDCQHLAAVLFHLESHYNELLVAYSKETDLESEIEGDEEEKAELLETLKIAESKEHQRQGWQVQKQLLEEYIYASELLGQSSFFHPEEETIQDKAELALIFFPPQNKQLEGSLVDFQLALRLPYRSKSLQISQIKPFLDSIRYQEAIYIGNKRFFFSMQSFDEFSAQILQAVMHFARFFEPKNDKQQRSACMDTEAFGSLLATAFSLAEKKCQPLSSYHPEEIDSHILPGIYVGSIEEPLRFCRVRTGLCFELDYLEVPSPKILLTPKIVVKNNEQLPCDEVLLFECALPGMMDKGIYYRFHDNIKRKHLRNLSAIRKMTIPEPLFGTFVENALCELSRFAEISNREIIDRFVTLPFVEQVGAECDFEYLNGELEASLHFLYGNVKVPAATSQLTVEHILSFATKDGVLARNLTEEQKMIDTLFQDFIYDPSHGTYHAKNEKKIVEFMTETIPAYQHIVKFNCPENLLDQFIYDDSVFILKLRESSRIDMYEVELKVNGYLNGVKVDLLWDCLTSKRAFVEMGSSKKQPKRKTRTEEAKNPHKFLVLDLEKLAPIVQIFDEMGISCLDDHVELRPLWSLANLNTEQFIGLPIEFSITDSLQTIQNQMLGISPFLAQGVPVEIQASLRNYQIDGTEWLERLRSMHLNGILADDMGLGKTLQAITTLTQYKKTNAGKISLVVCPTSLVYNWKEEFGKFNPEFRVTVVDGNPNFRKKALSELSKFDIVITSYTLLQKDIEFYKTIPFGYAILDEAQHIKNRGTRNAQSVKMVQAEHRLILTGTPVENSLDELWSLFDFLMPGLLSTYDRFIEKYVRNSASPQQLPGKNLENLQKKVAPFILRRMKKDVLDDLPPVSEIIYYSHLSDLQRELYQSYAASAREELTQLVKKEGFDRVQIHVLATLTRLKQICCHPAIFAKDQPDVGDSAKYDLLLELIQSLIEGQHKAVIFSQYTKMLNIMREDLQRLGIRFEYLDGSTKNRLSIVKKFNEDQNISIFLVSLKAGGSGLNLVGADTVIHYDMWWNPAVENQATDRVHRMGQKKSVSLYKLITLNTIEEKILELHNRKRGLLKDVISRDDDMMSKLTWEEVLELLQT